MPIYYEMLDGGESNVYHFLFYMVSNFLCGNPFDEIVYYYPNKKNCPVSEGFLALLPPNYTRHLTKDPSVTYKPFAHTIPTYNDFAFPESYVLLRALFGRFMSKTIIEGKKMYIWRKNADCRTFVNEVELQCYLREVGYEIVCMEEHSIAEQIRMISESEFIVGAHGAGLAMTVFCNLGAKVVEINPDTNVERRHFYHIAHFLRHKYFRFQNVEVLSRKNEEWKVNAPLLHAFLLEWHDTWKFR